MRLFSKKPRKVKFRRPPRIRIPRQTPEQLRLAMPTPSRPTPVPSFDPYPGLIDDPIGTQQDAEMRFSNEQVSAGREILRSGSGIETSADEQNVRAATQGHYFPHRLDGECEPVSHSFEPHHGAWPKDPIDFSPQVDLSPHLAESIAGFGGEFPQSPEIVPPQPPQPQEPQHQQAQPAPADANTQAPILPSSHFVVGG